jgi:primosomal replication protein N
VGEAPRNEVRIAGELIERAALRHTPAGVPVLNIVLRHESRQEEAGAQRLVTCEMQAVVLGREGELVAAAPLGSGLELTGFLAAKSLRNRQTVLHVTHIEFLEG